MSCSKKTLMIASSSTLTSLPLEILADILIKLPPKSLVRIRCVSKFFDSLVFNHPDLYSNWSLTLPSKMSILISAPITLPYPRYYTINYPQERNQGKLKPNRLHHMEDQNLFGNLYLRSCVNGLLCFCSFPRIGDEIAIHNPSTTQHISLPTIYCSVPLHFDLGIDVCALLGFDSVSRRYKVLKSIKYDNNGYPHVKHWVFTLGVDKSWREINCFPAYFPYDFTDRFFFRTNVHINGVIYSLNSLNEISRFHDIVAFDVATENFHKIPRPKELMDYQAGLIEVEGRLAIIYGRENRSGRQSYDMWIWTLEKSMEWQKHIIPIPIPLKEYGSMVFFTANHVGDIALLVLLTRSVSTVLFYNLRRRRWRNFGIGELHGPVGNYNMMWTVTMQFIVDNIYNVF